MLPFVIYSKKAFCLAVKPIFWNTYTLYQIGFLNLPCCVSDTQSNEARGSALGQAS